MIPLLAFAQRALGSNHSRFYFPGHTGGQGLEPVWAEVLPQFRDLGKLDIPELAGLGEAIAEAEGLMAQAYGAMRSWLLVNGSTLGLQAALMAVLKEGDQVLVGRNCHQSLLGGLVLTGAMPVYLPVEYDRQWRLDMGVSPHILRDYLQSYRQIKAVCLVSPTYFGMMGNLQELVAIAHGKGVPVIVDSAHGAHLGFHPDLPPSVLASGADIVVHSLHKNGSALSQGAALHWQGDLVSEAQLDQAVGILQTTSPNLILLLSLDIARWQLQHRGRELLGRVLTLVENFRGRSPLPVFASDDPTKLTLSTRELGITGFRADQLLTARGVICELPTFQHLLFSCSMGTTTGDMTRLLQALYQLFMVKSRSLLLPDLPNFYGTETEPVVSPRQAFGMAKERVDRQGAIGRLSGATLCPYPPGIPILTIGERITTEIVEYLILVHKAGGMIKGTDNLESWLVLRE